MTLRLDLRGPAWLAAMALGLYGFVAPSEQVSLPLCLGLALVTALTLESGMRKSR
jgi:hypothetical protein